MSREMLAVECSGSVCDSPHTAHGRRRSPDGIRTVDAWLNRAEERVLHDFLIWRDGGSRPLNISARNCRSTAI